MDNVGNSTPFFTAAEYDDRWIKAFKIKTPLATAPVSKTDRSYVMGQLVAPLLDANGKWVGDLAEGECHPADLRRGYFLMRDVWDIGTNARDAQGFQASPTKAQLEDDAFDISDGFATPYQFGEAISAGKLYLGEFEGPDYLDGIDTTTAAGTELTTKDGRLAVAGVGEFVVAHLECHIDPHVLTGATDTRIRAVFLGD